MVRKHIIALLVTLNLQKFKLILKIIEQFSTMLCDSQKSSLRIFKSFNQKNFFFISWHWI